MPETEPRSNFEEVQFSQLSPEGEGGIGLFFLYGDGVEYVLSDIFEPISGGVSWKKEGLYYGWLTDGDERVDEVVVRVVPERHPYTGRPTAELNTHSGPAILQRIQTLLEDYGASKRSSEKYMKQIEQQGGLNRLQRQAYESLLSTDTRRGAVALSYQLQGALSEKLQDLQDRLASDEVDRHEVTDHIDDLIRRGYSGLALTNPGEICIIGPPNAGKSTLMNMLSREERSIVHEEAGTTRDVVQETIYVQGYPFRVRDTAGLHASEDRIEQEGIRKGRKMAETADLVLWVANVVEEAVSPPDLSFRKPMIHIRNKEDLQPAPDYGFADREGVRVLHISAKEEEGIDLLEREILRLLNINHQLTERKAMPFREEQLQLLETVRDLVSNDSAQEAAKRISDYLSN